MPESAPTPHNYRLTKLTGAHFDVQQSPDEDGWVFSERPNKPITEDQHILLDSLGLEGLLLGEQSLGEQGTQVRIPTGSVSVDDLSGAFESEWDDQIQQTIEAAHAITGIPVKRLRQYAVLQNLPEIDQPAVKIAPSCIDELDTGRQIGGAAINRHLEEG